MDPKHQNTVSIILLGESKVGKTALIRRFDNDTFTTEFYCTLGTDFITKTVTTSSETIQAQIWDTAGQERFMTITKSFYQKADGILLVYDMTERESFDKLHTWFSSIHSNTSERVPKYLVANKVDLAEDRKVTQEEGQDIAKEFGMKYFETSAKTKFNVAKVFEEIIEKTYEMKKTRAKNPSIVLKEDREIVKPASKCC